MVRMIGAMSGTSADGVDVALVEVGDQWPRPTARLIGHHHHPYPPEMRREIFLVRQNQAVALSELAQLARDISLQYAAAVGEAVTAAQWESGGIAAIAAHGQTLYHNPPLTLQWLDSSLLAYLTGCRVVSDFRRADCAAGGQGAPLVPFADWILFSDPQESRLLLNLGGIANITYLAAGAALDQVIAFDTGPANCLSDWLCRSFDPSGPGFDENGQRAQKGRVIDGLLERFMGDEYFVRPPPKSTDGPQMIAAFQRAMSQIPGVESQLNDLLATAAAIVARTITQAVKGYPAGQWIVSGGGCANAAIMQELRRSLAPGVSIRSPDDWGIASQAKEALAFALLGAATLTGVCSNVPRVTGARQPMILGTITPAVNRDGRADKSAGL